MGGANSHVPLLPNLPSKIRKAAITQAIGRRLDKRKRLSRTLKRIIHYNSKHPNKDQCKLFKELVSSWTTVELSRLVEVYESTITLQQVAAEASAARPVIPDVYADLGSTLHKQTCSDTTIDYAGHCFACHKAILASRSEYFRKQFNQVMKDGEVIKLTPPASVPADHELFTQFLQYLYSDTPPDPEILSATDFTAMCEKFGVCGTAKQMLHHLQISREYSDITLVFLKTTRPNTFSSESVRLAEYPCHSVILASRSQLLRNLINRRMAESHPDSTEIVLDDAVVGYKYAPLILKLIYQDELDLSIVNSQANAATSSSLSEAEAIVAGRTSITLLEETMELHHIGNFLELPALIEKCEDFIVQSINTENLSTVLCWSLEASGSRWVYREALQYIQDNFRQISQSSALYSLDEPTLTKVLQSDFLQASELDVLQAVINWSEHQLIKKLESQEPNLVTHTAHSLARKGIKAKDLDDSQIREIASPLMLHVRQSHILSNNSTVVANAVKRGLVGTNTPRDITASEPILNIHSTYGQRGSWVPPTKTSVRRYEVPRAYMPFYDLAKALLEERTKDMSESDVVHLRRPGRANPTLNTLSRSRVLRHTTVQNMTRQQEGLAHIQFNPREVEEVIDKTEHLLQSPLVVQALQACWDKSAVLKQVCLWAVRELSYPDQIIYTVNSRATPPNSSDDTNPHLLTSSLVPDLAPEKLILQHGLSSSYENLTIHSVSSSPDVTLLSVRSYRHPVGGVGAAAAPFPDVTLHSHSSSDESSSPGASARPRGLLVSSLSKVKKYATNTAPPSARSKDSTRQACREKVDCKLQPDILGDASLSDSVSSRRLSPTHTSIRHASTLDSKPRRYRRRSQTVNPYHTPPRGSCNQSTSNLLYSSLTRNISVEYDRLLAQEGPPPDIAPQPSRRLTRTSTPPDITSSPSNTWQAML